MDPVMLMEDGLALCMGLALAATCGIRAFLPLLVISVLAALGKVELGEGFEWMASLPALVCFATAVVAEVVADKVPVVDHALDAAGVVIKPVAAAVVSASMVVGMDPLLALTMGLISGGVVAEGVHLVKAKARVLSSALTGTLGNPVLSVLEDLLAVAGVVMSVLVPVLGLVVFAVLCIWVLRRVRRMSSVEAAS